MKLKCPRCGFGLEEIWVSGDANVIAEGAIHVYKDRVRVSRQRPFYEEQGQVANCKNCGSELLDHGWSDKPDWIKEQETADER